MQEITNTICKNASIGTTGQLVDLRDNKTYWVTKLKDENCWMTQNLALDLSVSKKLTNVDSDVSSSEYTPSVDTQQGTITKFPGTSNPYFSYNPGEYVYTTPMKRNNCGTKDIKTLSGCPNWIPMAGLNRDTSGNEQAHYLAGNYYSYNVATAGTAPTAEGVATNSICPKGWTLPTGGDAGQYTTLVSGLTASETITTNNIKLAPYYFVYSGQVYSSSLNAAGSYGYYWSATVKDASLAYYLRFYTGISSDTDYHYNGNSVRCVAR